MLKLTKLHQYLLSILASIIFFLIALTILAISLIAANQQAVGIKIIF